MSKKDEKPPAWDKVLKILHLSDLNFALNPAPGSQPSWREVLAPAAIEAAIHAATDQRGPTRPRESDFDYIVVAGNYLGTHDDAVAEQKTAELKALLLSLLPPHRKQEDRLLLVPGPKDPKTSFAPTIRVLEEITLVAVDFAMQSNAPNGRRNTWSRLPIPNSPTPLSSAPAPAAGTGSSPSCSRSRRTRR